MATPDYRTQRLGELNKLAEQNRGLLSADPIFRKVYDGLDPIKRQRVDLGGLNLAELVSDYEQANLPVEEVAAPIEPTQDDFLTRVGKTAVGFGDVVTSGLQSKLTNYELAGTRRGMAMDEEEQALTSAASKLKTALGGLLPGPLSAAAQLSALDDMRQVTRAKEVQSDEEGTKALLDKLITARQAQKERSAKGYAAIDESGDPARFTRALAAVASQPEQVVPLLAGAGATAVGGPLAGYAAAAATAPIPAVVVYDTTYNDAVDAGLSDDDADSFAKWMASSEYALEAFSGGIAGSFGKTVLKSAIKQWAKQTGKTALVEGASEAATGTLQDVGNLALSQREGKLGQYAGAQLPKSLGDFTLRRYDEFLAGIIGGGAITAAPNIGAAREDSATERKFDAIKRSADAVEEAARISNASPNIVAAAAKGAQQATQLNLPGFGEQKKVDAIEPLPQVETQAKAEQARTEDQLKIRAGVAQQQATEAKQFAEQKEAGVQEALQFDLPVNQGDVIQGTEARAQAEAKQREADVLKLGVAATEQPLPLTGGEMGKKNFEDVVVGGKPYVRNKLTGELTDRRAQRIEEAKAAQQLKDKEALVAKTKSRETARKKYETAMIKRAADLGKDSTYVDEKMKQWDAEINPVPKIEDITAARVAVAQKADQAGSKPTGKRPKVSTTKTEDATAAMDAMAGITAPPPANLESVPESTPDGTKLEPVADDAKLRALARTLVRGLGIKRSDQLVKFLDKGNVKVVRHASQIPGWKKTKTEGVYNAKDGSVYLVASELTDATATPTILHELGHKFRNEGSGKKYKNAPSQLLGDKGRDKLQRDLEAAAARGDKSAIAAVRRAKAAQARNPEDSTVYVEELVGYSITQAELARQNRSPIGALGGAVRDIAQQLKIAYSDMTGVEIEITPDILSKLIRKNFDTILEGSPTKSGVAQSESVIGPKSTQFVEEAIMRPEDVYEGAKDKKRRIEISDYEATVKPGAIDYLKRVGSIRLGNYMNHPKLFDGYDRSIDRTYEDTLFTDGTRQDFTVTYGPLKNIFIRTDDIDTNAYYDPNNDEIVVSKNDLNNPDELREWIAHEIQHAIQAREGFVSGTDLFSLMSEEAKKVGADYVLKKKADGGSHVTFTGVTKEKASEIFEKAWNKYDRSYGEAEARVTQINWKMTPEEMREALPEDRMTSQEGGTPLKREQLESVATIEENLPPQMFESVALELAMLGDGRLKRPEEPYDGPMIATHNTRLDKLASVIKRGMIMPSIGILNNNSRIPDEFGEITLVLKKGFLRPYRNNRIVAGDSYSKTPDIKTMKVKGPLEEYVKFADNKNNAEDFSMYLFTAIMKSLRSDDFLSAQEKINYADSIRPQLDDLLSREYGGTVLTDILASIYKQGNFVGIKDQLKLWIEDTVLLLERRLGIKPRGSFPIDYEEATKSLFWNLSAWLPTPEEGTDGELALVVNELDEDGYSRASEVPLTSKKAQRQLKVRNPKGDHVGAGWVEFGPFLAAVKPEISSLTQLRKEARLLNKYRVDRDARDMFNEVAMFGSLARETLAQVAKYARRGDSETAILKQMQNQYPELSHKVANAMAVYRAARLSWVDYFEAKHGGVLDFEKSVAAVAVDGKDIPTVQAVRDILRKAGIDIPVVKVWNNTKTAADLIDAVDDNRLDEAIWRGSEKDVPKTGYESVYEAPDTEEFKTWFGNSKIVDENGNPLKFYHGAPGGKFGFDTFMRNSLGLIFVSPEAKFAKIFAGMGDDTYIGGASRDFGGIYELYIRAEKPFDYDNVDDIERLTEGNNSVLLRAYNNIWGPNLDYSDAYKIAQAIKQLKKGDWGYYETPSVIEWMEDNGYDAMYIEEAGAKNLAVFDPNQLKSANANQGTFRLDSNNIYESVVDETDDSGTKQAVRGIGRLLGIDKLLAPTMLNRIVDHPGGYTAHIAVLADTQAALWKEGEARVAKQRGVKPKVIRQEVDKRIAAIDKLTDANARASALLALDRDYPGVGKAVAKMRDLKWGLSRMAYSLRRRDPKPLTDKEVSIYKKMFENAETYNTRAYQATFGLKSEKYGKEFLKRANKNPQSEEGVKLKAAIDYLVANNLLIPDATTLSNMKKPQLRRMYETWSNRAPGKMKRATMIAELGKIVVPNRAALEAKALRIVEEMLGQTKMLGPIAKQFVGQKLDRTILEARKEVPKVLRDVMGEITDPYVKELLSIARLTQLVARTKMLNELSEQGKGTLWTDEKGENTKFQVNGEAFGPLDGKWVNADVQQLLRDQLTMTTSIEDAISGAMREPEQILGKAVALGVKGATKIAGWWKLTNVVFSVQNFGANLVGSPAMAIMNGVYSPTTWVSSFYKTAKALASAEFPGNEKGGDYAAEYLYANVLDSATVGEFRGQVYDNIFSEIAKLDNKDPNFFVNAGKKVWEMIGTGVASAREGYALMDVWAKVASYEVRKELLTDYYKALGVTKSSKEIWREAGYDISTTNISYNRAPPIIKMIERTVPFAAFLTYFAEVFRSVGGSLYLAAQDAQRAAQAVSAGNAKAATVMGTAAVKRLAGTVAATGGVVALTNYMLDSEDEEEKRKRLLDPDWETNNPRVVLGQNAQGKDITLGLNRFDPLGPMNEAVVAVMRAKDGEQWDQIGVEIEGLLVKNKGAMQFYKTIWDASLKAADTVAPNLYKDILGRTEYGDLSDNAKELLWQYVPAPAKSLSPEYPVIASNKPEDMRALGDALTSIGAKLYVRDEEKAIRFRVWDFKGTTDAIRKDYRSFLEDFDGSPEELYESVEELAEREERAVADLAAAYDGYQAYGKTSRDFLAILKEEKVDGNTVKGLLRGEYLSGIFTGDDLDTMFKTKAKALDKKAPDYAEQLKALREEKALFREAYLKLRESE